MKIAESSVTMSAKRTYSQSGFRANNLMGASQNQVSGLLSRTKDYYENSTPEDFLSTYERLAGNNIADEDDVNNVKSTGFDAALEDLARVRNQLLSRMMQQFSDGSVYGPNMGMINAIQTYSEYESTEFSAYGRALTEDGRVIDFNVDVMMSRSYMEYMDIQIPAVNNALMDPLMINIGSGVANISDQKFMFDLDCDGIEDEISMIGKGTGFLALDLNEDGVINDGRELFGTQSGDGFEDLRKYDSDGNGWIDENDEVFNRLKIWCMNEDGTSTLMNLKDADIGAIYLGEQSTDFSMYGLSGGLNGQIRSTGFFLKENGGIGTVQHVDLALGKSESGHFNAQGVDVQTKEVTPSMLFVSESNKRNYFESTQNKDENGNADTKSISERKSQLRKDAELRRMRIHERKKMFKEFLEKQRVQRKEEREKTLDRIQEERDEDISEERKENNDEILKETLETVEE